jgi:lipid-A-disaccharide synthase
MWRARFATLPNLLLDREVVPELLQDDATPERLAESLEALLADPAAQLREMRAVRATLGAPDALERCAAFAVALAGTRA